MTKHESKRSSVAAAEPADNGPAEPASAAVTKQSSRENLHRRNAECEVYDDGTNTFFWWVLVDCANTGRCSSSRCFDQNKRSPLMGFKGA